MTLGVSFVWITYCCLTYILEANCETRLCTDNCTHGDNVKVGGRCFFTSYKRRLNWNAADDYCKEQLCSGLAVLNLDPDSTTQLKSFMVNKWNDWHGERLPDYRWVGISPKTSGDIRTGWTWRNGESADELMVDADTSSLTRQPSPDYPLCVLISRTDITRSVVDCSLNYGFICELGLSATNPEISTLIDEPGPEYYRPSVSSEIKLEQGNNVAIIVVSNGITLLLGISLTLGIYICLKKRRSTSNYAEPVVETDDYLEPMSIRRQISPPASGSQATDYQELVVYQEVEQGASYQALKPDPNPPGTNSTYSEIIN